MVSTAISCRCVLREARNFASTGITMRSTTLPTACSSPARRASSRPRSRSSSPINPTTALSAATSSDFASSSAPWATSTTPAAATTLLKPATRSATISASSARVRLLAPAASPPAASRQPAGQVQRFRAGDHLLRPGLRRQLSSGCGLNFFLFHRFLLGSHL